jgi:ferredoxin, 2Fe-2S
MVAIRFIRRAPDGQTHVQELQALPGRSVMQAAVEAGIDGIVAECGGVLVCATCHVYVAPDWATRLPAANDDERAMLEFTAAPRRNGSRLCCQLVVEPRLDGLTLELPERQY